MTGGASGRWFGIIGQFIQEQMHITIMAPPPLLALRGAAFLSSFLAIGAGLGVMPI